MEEPDPELGVVEIPGFHRADVPETRARRPPIGTGEVNEIIVTSSIGRRHADIAGGKSQPFLFRGFLDRLFEGLLDQCMGFHEGSILPKDPSRFPKSGMF